MSKYATKEQLISIVQDMASKISVPTIGIGGGYAPIGTVISYMGVTAPQDYLACDGSVYNISAYSDLADFFQAQFGSKNYFGGDGVTTFGVPTLTGAPTSSIYCIKAKAIGYSTDEQIIGSWIDGKPLYQKSYTGTWTIDAGSFNANIADISFVDTLVDVKGTGYDYSGGSTYGRTLNSYTGFGFKNGNNLGIQSTFKMTWTSITIQYTKTTD